MLAIIGVNQERRRQAGQVAPQGTGYRLHGVRTYLGRYVDGLFTPLFVVRSKFYSNLVLYILTASPIHITHWCWKRHFMAGCQVWSLPLPPRRIAGPD